MAIKWSEADVIKAMNEALSPSQNGTGSASQFQQLLNKVKEQRLSQTGGSSPETKEEFKLPKV